MKNRALKAAKERHLNPAAWRCASFQFKQKVFSPQIPSFPFVTHEGSMLGYRCQIAFNPEIKIGWVILTNTTNFDFSRMNEYISRLIVPHYSKPAVYELKKYTAYINYPAAMTVLKSP
ncbi:MAG TPA: hypothetical protein VFN95_08535 [Flavitalea sp.]|nr:hypothetical protein [Flavitalea sp.]